MKQQLELTSPAKVNLLLDITGKRPDGFHELKTIMQKINLLDRITLSLETGPTSITISSNCDYVPLDMTNLACRAAQLFFQTAGIERRCHIDLFKNIPAGAGLGGGSSNAACVLWGLNQMLETPLNTQTLLELSAQLGSDVAFFVDQEHSTAFCSGRGERIEKFLTSPIIDYVLVTPDIHISTKLIYNKLERKDLTAENGRIRILNDVLEKKSFSNSDLSQLLYNSLEKPAGTLFPDIIAIKQLLLDSGCKQAMMSGSGSSVFGIVQDSAQARQTLERLHSAGVHTAFHITTYGDS